MRKRTAIGAAIAVVFLVTVTVELLWPRQRVARPRDLTMSFAGFTNINDRSAAIFICTNDTSLPLMLNLKGIEYRSDGIWQMSTGRAMVAGIPTSGMSMAPQARSIWVVPVHSTNIPWRLRILCVETATGIEGEIDRANDAVKSVANNGRLGTYTTYEGRNYEIVASSELTK